MIKNIPFRLTNLFYSKRIQKFANFTVNNPTTGKPCADFPHTDTAEDMKK